MNLKNVLISDAIFFLLNSFQMSGRKRNRTLQLEKEAKKSKSLLMYFSHASEPHSQSNDSIPVESSPSLFSKSDEFVTLPHPVLSLNQPADFTTLAHIPSTAHLTQLDDSVPLMSAPSTLQADDSTLLPPTPASLQSATITTETNDNCTNDGNGTLSFLWPSVYTEKMWRQKEELYPWLTCNNGKLGCNVCRNVANISGHKVQGTGISKGWTNIDISCNGTGRQQQLTSFRKKIKEHMDSHAHKACERIAKTAKQQTVEKAVDNVNMSQFRTTEKVLRTAYYVAKNDRPYTDHPQLLELQNMNGINTGFGLVSRWSATQIIDHVAMEMRKRVCRYLQECDAKIAILIDESTVTDKSALIIYLNCEIDQSVEFFSLIWWNYQVRMRNLSPLHCYQLLILMGLMSYI